MKLPKTIKSILGVSNSSNTPTDKNKAYSIKEFDI